MSRRNRERWVAAALALVAAPGLVRALDATEWKNRQPLIVERAGVLKIALSPETLGLARPGLADLRLLDPAGAEVPFVFTSPAPPVPRASRAPASFRATLSDPATQLLLETGTTLPLEAVTLATPAPVFLKSAKLEISADGEHWETLAAQAAIFRQFGAEQLRFEFKRRTAAHVRVTIDDTRSRPVPFTGARLQIAGDTPPEVTLPIAVRIVRRDEYAGETVLTLDLGGAHVPLASLQFETAEPLFARPVTFAARELRDDVSVERTLGSGSIWRVVAEGAVPSTRLDVPVAFTPPALELLVHLANGDSPPLAVERVAATQRPLWLVFRAAAPGSYTLLTGNAQIAAPRYDLAALASALRDTPPSGLTAGPAAPNPGYRAPDLLASTPLLGAALDPAPWSFRKAVQPAGSGVQQLELDLEVLARAQAGLADLRLVQAGLQVPFLLERPALSRSRALGLAPALDPKRPRLGRWQIKLPCAGVPITRISLASSTVLFQRQFRLIEIVSDERRGNIVERTLAAGEWSRRPGETQPLTLSLAAVPAVETILLETDNGDNPPIVLTTVHATYPVARLLFKAEPAAPVESPARGIALYYGNRAAVAPRYDLALVARHILTAEKAIASLGAEETMRPGGGLNRFLGGMSTGVVFWGALLLVVIGLLVIVARLLPKPPPPSG